MPGDDLVVADVDFLGHPGVIAAGLLVGSEGVALVDPGPPSSLPGLKAALAREGVSLRDVVAVLATHIHLDHAGASGAIVRENPRVQVYVHERGAAHLVDPSRLLASARRLYGESMDRLWGEIVPVPAANARSLKGGEQLNIAGREVRVAYTPGHAWHHVTYFDVATGTAFVGDTGGARIGPSRYVMPTTPPPDIDLDAWDASIDRILAWHPCALFLTHFGWFPDPNAHLRDLANRLRELAGLAQASLEQPGSDEERMAQFAQAVGRDLRAHMPEEEAARYELAVPPDHCWLGLARYWRRKSEVPSPA